MKLVFTVQILQEIITRHEGGASLANAARDAYRIHFRTEPSSDPQHLVRYRALAALHGAYGSIYDPFVIPMAWVTALEPIGYKAVFPHLTDAGLV